MRTKKTRENYIDPKELLDEVVKARNTEGAYSDKLGNMLQLLTQRILRHSNFRNYPPDLKEDMAMTAICKIIKYVPKVKLTGEEETDKKRVFNYFTRICFTQFLVVINGYYKQRNIQRELTRQYAEKLEQINPAAAKKLIDDLLELDD